MTLVINLGWFVLACALLGGLALALGWTVDYFDKKDRGDANRIDL